MHLAAWKGRGKAHLHSSVAPTLTLLAATLSIMCKWRRSQEVHSEPHTPTQTTCTRHAPCESCVQVRDVGVVLAHGNDASEWKGRLLTEVASQLARAGRCVCRWARGRWCARCTRVSAVTKVAGQLVSAGL